MQVGGSFVHKNTCYINETYLNYMYNLTRDKFFNSDGKSYFGRQILFLGDSHGWGEGSPNYQGASSGFNVHTPWIHNKGFFNRVIEFLYKKMDTQPWRCIPLTGMNCTVENDDISEDMHVGGVYPCSGVYSDSPSNIKGVSVFIDEETFTTTPAFVKGRYWIYQSAAKDNTDSYKESLNAFCNAESRGDLYSEKNYSYNADIGLLGKNVFALAPDIDRPTEEFYQVTACNGMQHQLNTEQYQFFSNKCGGIDSGGIGFLTIRGNFNTLPSWLKTKGQRIYIPELGALKIVSTEKLFINNDFIKLSIKNFDNGSSDYSNIDFKTLESVTYPGMIIYKSYYGKSCVLMDIKTPTRYLVLSLITQKEYGGKAKIELLSNFSKLTKLSNRDGFISLGCNESLGYYDNLEYYGNEVPSVYRLVLPGDSKSYLVPALNAIVYYKSTENLNSNLNLITKSELTVQQHTNSIIIDTSDDINASSEEFYIIDFKQKKQGTIRISIAGSGKYNTKKHPATNTEVLISRGMLCGNMDLFRNWSMGGHSTGAWLGQEESYWKDTRNHIKDAVRYMTASVKGVVIEAPLVNEWLKQTPVDIFKSRLTNIIKILQCSNVIIFTTLGLKDREFGAFAEDIADNNKNNSKNNIENNKNSSKNSSKISFEQYSVAVQEWAKSQPMSELCNVTFIDCRKYLKDLVYKGIIKPDDLYINNGHPSPTVNEIIADMLITAINFKY